jgi:hypothetical protein
MATAKIAYGAKPPQVRSSEEKAESGIDAWTPAPMTIDAIVVL